MNNEFHVSFDLWMSKYCYWKLNSCGRRFHYFFLFVWHGWSNQTFHYYDFRIKTISLEIHFLPSVCWLLCNSLHHVCSYSKSKFDFSLIRMIIILALDWFFLLFHVKRLTRPNGKQLTVPIFRVSSRRNMIVSSSHQSVKHFAAMSHIWSTIFVT